MKSNWYALYISILKKRSTDEALRDMGIILFKKQKPGSSRRGVFTEIALKEMHDLRLNNYTFKEIADRYGASEDQARRSLYRYRKRNDLPIEGKGRKNNAGY